MIGFVLCFRVMINCCTAHVLNFFIYKQAIGLSCISRVPGWHTSVDFKKEDLLALLFEYSLQRSLIKAD
jgi:hypothetical protein